MKNEKAKTPEKPKISFENEPGFVFRHTGFIVDDAMASVATFKKIFNLTDDDVRIMDLWEGVRFAFISFGEVELELIQANEAVFRKSIGDPPSGINHIAYTVKKIEKEVDILAKKGIRLGHFTKDGIFETGKTKLAYLDPADTGGILIELVEDTE